jgi:beta-phosphoglucomutase-like phosphatase (HAD superfamily)
MDQIKKQVKAIIFDMDGTIIKTEHIWRQVTVDVLAHRGIPLSPETEAFLKTLSGMGLTNAIIAIKNQYKLTDSIEALETEKILRADTYFKSHVEFIEGFEGFHTKLQEHAIPTSIATNATLENLQGLTQKLDLSRYFGTNLYCAAHVGNKAKPDPALFLHAAKQLGALPSECVVFEDSLYGFQAAQAAGMKCIAIKNELNSSQLDSVHGSINTYHEAEEILKKI